MPDTDTGGKNMILHNVYIKGNTGSCDIHIDGEQISHITAANDTAGAIKFEHAIAFPGLINSHDHLDFNSFPLLGNKIYDNYVAWGNDIHDQNKDAIQAVLSIPKSLRVQWSIYKNLLNGITTVVQHGEHFTVNNELIDIFQECVSIHSVRLEKKWKLKLNKPRKNNLPVVIHIGEGTNADAAKEIDELVRWNLLDRKLIGIHGVAMSTAQAKHFSALIWSPDSNYFLLDKTADITQLKKIVPVIFGTDSTLTGHWNVWEQLRIAANTHMANTQELYDMVITTPANVWQLKNKGQIAPGFIADIVVAESTQTGFEETFIATDPENILLVIHRGRVRLFDESLYEQLTGTIKPKAFSKIMVQGRTKYVYGNLPELMQQIRDHHPGIIFPDIQIP